MSSSDESRWEIITYKEGTRTLLFISSITLLVLGVVYLCHIIKHNKNQNKASFLYKPQYKLLHYGLGIYLCTLGGFMIASRVGTMDQNECSEVESEPLHADYGF